MIQGENFRDWLKNHESFPPRKFCRIRYQRVWPSFPHFSKFCSTIKITNSRAVTALPVSHKYFHFYTLIGLFSLLSKTNSAMSSSSSSERRHKKKKKGHHWRGGYSSEGVTGELSSAMTDLRQQLSKDFKEIQESIDSVPQRITRLETKALDSKQSIAITTESRPEHVAEPTPQKWVESLGTPADFNVQNRTGDSPWDEREDLPNYEELIYWSPAESDGESDGESSELSKISEGTAKVIQDSFLRCSQVRKGWARRENIRHLIASTPSVPDWTLPSNENSPSRQGHRHQPSTHTSVGVDTVNPLVNLLESACKGTFTPRDAADSAQQALRLLGNASATISTDRRQKATQFLNKELSTLVQEEDTFRDAAPLLFGKDFDKRAK